jgi:hypothetical protein
MLKAPTGRPNRERQSTGRWMFGVLRTLSTRMCNDVHDLQEVIESSSLFIRGAERCSECLVCSSVSFTCSTPNPLEQAPVYVKHLKAQDRLWVLYHSLYSLYSRRQPRFSR